MEQKQTKINRAKSSINDVFKSESFSNYSIENQNSYAPLVGSSPIDYSDRQFYNLASAEANCTSQSGPDSGVTLEAVSSQTDLLPADCETREDTNLSSSIEGEITNQYDKQVQLRRPDITFVDRLQISARFFHTERPWGEVTCLATEFGLSRQSIYDIAYHYQSLLSAPRVLPRTVLDSPATASCQSLTDIEMLNLRARLILTSVFPGGVTMRPLEDILAEVPFINSPSDTTIWRIINQAGQQADEILSQVDVSLHRPPACFGRSGRDIF